MLDWLAVWGATQAVGLIVKPILEELVKEAGKDWAKDLLKGIPSQILDKLKKEDREIAAAKALKEFLQLMQQDLEDSGLSEDEIKKYKQPIKHYLKHQEVKEHLGNAFKDDAQTVDIDKLAELWNKINSASLLPDDFNWKRLGKKYVQKVKEIIREFPELRDIIDSQNIEKIKEYTNETAGIIPEFDLQRYQEGIRECYGNLKLESLDTTGYAYNELKLWRMFVPQNAREVNQVLPQVHELPKEHLRRLRESNQLEAEIQAEELESHKRVYLEQPIRLVLDVVNDKQTYKYIVILGDPGSGKSTLLQFLALNWAESSLNNAIFQPIPLLIELRTYIRRREDKECNNFVEFFHKCSGAITHLNQHQLHEQLKAGNAVVMFDGLDEVFDPGKREDVITDIHRFTNDYPNVQVIVTSRVIGYKAQRLRDAEFRHFMLQDLDSEQIQDFIHRWHELTFSDTADKVRKRERLLRGIEASIAITELAGNPLLLTMMAILNRNQELPRDRPELYNQASRVLLHQWDVERALIEDKRLDPKTIDYKDKQAMLRQFAYFMQTSDQGLAGNLISASDLEKILTNYLKTIEVSPAREAAKIMIDQLRTRNFMLCFMGADSYSFVHRTFLEYFCAWEFVWQFKETQTLNIEELKKDVFGKHWQDETWHEVLLLIAGMIEPKFTSQIIDYLIEIAKSTQDKKSLFLAADCLIELKNRSLVADTAGRLLEALKNIIDSRKEKSTNKEGEKAEQKTENSEESLENEESPADRLRRLLEEHRKKQGQEKSSLSEEEQEEQSKVFKTIALAFPGNANALSWLKNHAESNFYSLLRAAAVQAVANGWKQAPETLEWLKLRAQSEQNSDVRRAAVEEIAKGWRSLPDTLEWLKGLASSEENRDVLSIAVEGVAKSWKYDPEVLPWLKNLAHSEESEVRQAAIQGLIQCGRDLTKQKQYEKALKLYEESRQFLKEADEDSRKALAKAFRDCADKFNPWTNPSDSKHIRLMTYSALHQAAELVPENVKSDLMSAMRLIQAYRQVDRHEEAIAIARQFNDSNPLAYSFLGDAYCEYGNYAKAIEVYQSLLKNNSNNSQTHSNLGDVYHRLGKYDEAIAFKQKALELSSNDSIQQHFIYRDICWIYCDLGRYEESIAAGKQAIELFPKNQPFNSMQRTDYHNLGATYVEMEDYENAQYYLNRAIENHPEYHQARSWLCRIDIKQNNLAKAEREIKQIIAKRWKPSKEYFELGLIYALRGRMAEARLNWQKSLEYSYNNSLWEKIRYTFRTIVLDNMKGIDQMQNILTQYQPPDPLLKHNVLWYVDIMSRCPTQPQGIKPLVQIIEKYINSQTGSL